MSTTIFPRSQIVFLSMQHPDEKKYKFATPSTMKPTQISCSEGAVNQIPAWVEMKGSTLTSEVVRKFSSFAILPGDIRLTPFYNVYQCRDKVKGYVDELNKGKHD